MSIPLQSMSDAIEQDGMVFLADAFSEALQILRLKGSVCSHSMFCPPWAMSTEETGDTHFLIVTEGSCWLKDSDGMVQLHAGEFVLFPFGCAHTLVSDEDIPFASDFGAVTTNEDGTCQGGAAGTRVIAGQFELDPGAREHLFMGVPKRMRLRGECGSWTQHATVMAELESSNEGPGSAAIIDRLTEALLIAMLRGHAAASAKGSGLLGALTDERLAKALSCIHEQPERAWTVADLAKEAGMSRATFARRFREYLNDTPSAYATRWRLLKARELLLRGQGMEEVAASAGYANAFSFSKSFKRVFGVSPSHWLQEAR